MNTKSDISSFGEDPITGPLPNWINELFQSENLQHTWPWTVLFILIYSVIFIVGIAGNFIVIFVFCRRRQMKSVTNMFVVNLAIADLFVILFCVPVALISTIFVPWVLGVFICKGVAYIQRISIFSSAYSLAVISAVRCKGIHRFLPVINKLTKLHALVIIAGIWTTAFLILLPWPIVFEVNPMPENGTTLSCIENWTDEYIGDLYFLFGNLMCCYAIPGLFICITNWQVWRRVMHREDPVSLISPRYLINHHRRTKLGGEKKFSIIAFTFLFSWLPLYVVMCRVKFTSIESMSEMELDVLEVLIPIFHLLGTSNSCVNPILYHYINSRFREMCTSVFYVSIECNFPCFQMFRQNTNTQTSVVVTDTSSIINNVCHFGNCTGNYAAWESNFINSGVISPMGYQCGCENDTQFCRALPDKDVDQAQATTCLTARWPTPSLECSQETSV